ncbi:MAG: TetR/AcrR family transcriptional regulator [Candidatus Hydrogenedentota bacterium]
MEPKTRRRSAKESIARIHAAAAQLFAEYGYHGVTTRQIAAEAGLNIGTVHHHVGTKHALYTAVYARLFSEDEALVAQLEQVLAAGTPTDAASWHRLVRNFVDTFVGHVSANPMRARLYVRHWLETDPALREFGTDRSLALYRAVRRILRRARAQGFMSWQVDPGIMLRNVDFMVYSYFVCGAFNWQTWRSDPLQERNLKRFKESLYVYVIGCLDLAAP